MTVPDPLVLRNATVKTGTGRTLDIGKGNPAASAFVLSVEGTTLEYPVAHSTVAGGAVVQFRDGGKLRKADSAAAAHHATLTVAGRATLDFGPGTDLHWGAASTDAGSVGNATIDFSPDEAGWPSLVLDGAKFYYHHPSGNGKAAIRVDGDSTYEARYATWNYTMPFVGFGSAEIADGATLVATTTASTPYPAQHDTKDPRRMTAPASFAFAGEGSFGLATADSSKPFRFLLTSSGNSATGEISAAPGTTLVFEDGSNWAGTLVASANVSGTNSATGAASATVDLAAVAYRTFGATIVPPTGISFAGATRILLGANGLQLPEIPGDGIAFEAETGRGLSTTVPLVECADEAAAVRVASNLAEQLAGTGWRAVRKDSAVYLAKRPASTGGETGGASENWFDVAFGGEGYVPGAIWIALSDTTASSGTWSEPDGVTELVVSADGSRRYVALNGSNALEFTPDESSPEGADVSASGLMRVTAGESLPDVAGAKAALAFKLESGSIAAFGLFDGAWRAVAPPDETPPEQGEWLRWAVDCDMTSDFAPRVRYRLSRTAEGMESGFDSAWTAVAEPPENVASVVFGGDGEVSDFLGTWKSATVVVEFEKPEFDVAGEGAGARPPIAVENGKFSVRMANAAAGAWYTAFAADSLDAPFVAEADSVQVLESGPLELAVAADGPARFVRIVASASPFSEGDPFPEEAAAAGDR